MLAAHALHCDVHILLKCLSNSLLSTDYAALLTQHPRINFSIKKELHFFDNPKKFNQGIKSYLKGFSPIFVQKDGSSHSKEKTFSKDYLLPNGLSGLLKRGAGGGGGAPVNTSAPGLPPLNVESTPYYIASDSACAQIAKSIPNVRLILLLREPVSRAYSEYNMKKRCVRVRV
jgi:hypothetical protein